MFVDPAQKAAGKMGVVGEEDRRSMSTIHGFVASKAKDGAKALFQVGMGVLQQPQHDLMDQDIRDMVTPVKTQLNRALASVKLEQMSRSSIVFSLSSLYLSSCICLAAAIVVAVVSSGVDFSVSTVNASLVIEGLCRTVAMVIVLFLMCMFSFRVVWFHSRSHTTVPIQQEQLLLIVFLLLLMVTPGMSVFSPILYWNQYAQAQINGPLLYENNPFNLTEVGALYVAFFANNAGTTVVITSVCTVLVCSFGFAYFGLTTHYFGIAAVDDNNPEELHRECLHLGKRMLERAHRGILVMVIVYSAVFIPLVRVYDFLPSQVPFMGMISVLKVCTTGNGYCSPSFQDGIGFKRAMVVVAQFVMEAFSFWYVHRVSVQTVLNLKNIPYETARAKHLGFKFFTSNKRMMYFFVFLCSVIVVACSAAAVETFEYSTETGASVNPLQRVGITFYSMGFGSFYLLLASFLFSFAYAYLPPDSEEGFLGFFCGGKRVTGVDTAPVYVARVTDVRVIREAKLKMQLEEETDSESKLHAMRRMLFLSTRRLRESPGKMRRAFAPSQTSDNVDNADNNDDGEVEEETLEQKMFGASDTCYQTNANFFCLETEVLMLNLSFMAYLDEVAVCRVLPDNITLVERIENPDTEIQCYIAVDDQEGVVYIFFRGTSSSTNIWQDLNYFQMPPQIKAEEVEPLYDAKDLFQQTRALTQKPMVHRGFYRAYLSVRDQIVQCVSDLIDSSPCHKMTLFCTGHSLGGALATHFAADIGVKYRKQQSKVWGIQLSTFGSPRVGNFAYTSRVMRVISTAHRFCVGGDPVPKLPPSQYFGSLTYDGFQHLGVEILLDVEKINLLIAPLFIEKQIQHAWRGYVPNFHSMSSYALSLLFWNARVHPKFTPDWWLPVVNTLLQYETSRLKTVQKIYPEFAANISEQLDKEGAVYWTADMRSYQNRGCDTAMAVEEVDKSDRFASWQTSPVVKEKTDALVRDLEMV